MPSSFILNLDTTGPQDVAVTLNGGAALANTAEVAAAVTTTDADTSGYTVKLWGDVDPAANPDVQPLEADSAWITLTPSIAVVLAAGNGTKTVNARLRDDVWNESALATTSIALDTTAPVVTLLAGPAPPKVSKVDTPAPGKHLSAVTWSSDSDFDAYSVRVVPDANADHTAGIEIGTAAGSINTGGGAGTAADPITTTISGADLEAADAGDGDKTIKVFVREATSGLWSV